MPRSGTALIEVLRVFRQRTNFAVRVSAVRDVYDRDYAGFCHRFDKSPGTYRGER
jgi:hypothetical protein